MTFLGHGLVRLVVVLLSTAVLATALAVPASAKPRTVIIAGDIAENSAASGAPLTADLVERLDGLVITAGDNVYDSGTLGEFQTWYEPTWGRFLDRTRATPGNHEYYTPGAKGYFAYFGWRAGPDRRGYYSFKVGNWRVYALDSEDCKDANGCGWRSAQYKWLKKKLAEHNAKCSLAVLHTPRYSSGFHGNESAVAPLTKLLYKSGAEIIVNGHDHNYERMAPARPNGKIDWKKGIQQIIVGTGGAPMRPISDKVVTHSRTFQSEAWGVLRLRLMKNSYSWKFLAVEGEDYSDQGERSCHGKP